ncbi:hypothetical protein QZH41_008138, partial [Actinostola sp. cb2023]
TAENILKRSQHSKDLVLVRDPRIREKGYGVFEGKPREYVLEQIRKHSTTAMEYVPEGGESVPQMTERAVNFFNDLCKKIHTENTSSKSPQVSGNSAENSNTLDASRNIDDSIDSTNAYVLMICHGGTIRQLFYHFVRNISSQFEGKGKKDVGKLSPNTGVSHFEVFVGRESARAEFIKCTMLYDGSHLIGEDEKILHEDRAL